MTTPDRERHVRFVEAFASFWSAPSPERMAELLTEDVRLVQPLAPPMVGLEAAQQEFRQLFEFIPDLKGEVRRWSGEGDLLYIELTLSGTLAGKAISWDLVDRFDLPGDKATLRVTYFDSWPLLVQVLRTPGAWWRWWRSGAGRPSFRG